MNNQADFAGGNSIGKVAATATPWQILVRPRLEKILAEQSVPGLVLAVARHEESAQYLFTGVDAAGLPLTANTLFPVASITKLATSLTVLRLNAAGALALDEPLATVLPDAACAEEGVTIRSILCHTAGLPPDLAPGAAPYIQDLNWPLLARACLETPLICPPQTRVAYSNLGSGLLAIVVERLTTRSFAEALDEWVLKPLGVEGYVGVKPPRSPARLIGDLGEHAGTELEPYNSAFWRSLALPWGGLLTNASGALSLLRAFAGIPADFLPPWLRAEATSDQTRSLSGGMDAVSRVLSWSCCPWGLGVELRGTKSPHMAPSQCSPRSFGHAGASGCLVWFDPATQVGWAMLGTRTFESWWTVWPELGAAVLAALEQSDLKEQSGQASA